MCVTTEGMLCWEQYNRGLSDTSLLEILNGYELTINYMI